MSQLHGNRVGVHLGKTLRSFFQHFSFANPVYSDQTPGLMIGDAYDLQMIFNWASSFWNHDLQGLTWNSGFRGGVARALHELAEAFADIVRAHQEEPCTTVSGDVSTPDP